MTAFNLHEENMKPFEDANNLGSANKRYPLLAFIADHRVFNATQGQAILDQEWGHAKDKLDFTAYVDHELVTSEILAMKKRIPDWETSFAEYCRSMPYLCMGHGIPLQKVVFKARTRVVLQILLCGIDVALVDSDTIFGEKPIGTTHLSLATLHVFTKSKPSK